MIGTRLLKRLALLALLAPGAAQAAPPEIAMPNRWHQMTVTLEKNSKMVIAMFPQEVGGKIAFCGAYWPDEKGSLAISLSGPIFRATIIEVRGRAIPANLRVFKAYNDPSEVTTATCAVTGRPWAGPYKTEDIVIRMRGRSIQN